MTNKTAEEYAKDYDRVIIAALEESSDAQPTLATIIQSAMDTATQAERERCAKIVMLTPIENPLGMRSVFAEVIRKGDK